MINELLKDLTRANNEELWSLWGTVATTLNSEMDANKGDINSNNKVWFWYDLYKLMRSEIDKRMVKED